MLFFDINLQIYITVIVTDMGVYNDVSELLPKKDGQLKTSQFLQEIVGVLIDYVHKENDSNSKVI